MSHLSSPHLFICLFVYLVCLYVRERGREGEREGRRKREGGKEEEGEDSLPLAHCPCMVGLMCRSSPHHYHLTEAGKHDGDLEPEPSELVE